MNQRDKRIKRLTKLLVGELQKDGQFGSASRWASGDIDDYGPQGTRRSANWLEQRAFSVLQAADLRDELFGADLFSDPAWFILVDLFRYQVRGEETCVTSACHAARAPATTALRRINIMEEKGIIVRHADRLDLRRQYLHLSKSALAAMRTYFARTFPSPGIEPERWEQTGEFA